MKLGLKDMKKEYKKVNLDEIEVWPFCFQSLYCFLISIFSLPLLHYTLTYTCNVRSCGKQFSLVISGNMRSRWEIKITVLPRDLTSQADHPLLVGAVVD